MNIADHIERGSRDYPDRPALIFDGDEITYRECDQSASKAAGAFAAAGVQAGDRVALFLPNATEFALAYLGALKLGAVAVSINANLKRNEVEFILDDCGPKVAVTTPELREYLPSDSLDRVFETGADFDFALAGASPVSQARAMEPDDPAVIVYTSGTTGQPKGATLSHANVVRNIEAKRRYLGIRAEDRGLLFMPLYHCFGQNAVFNAFLHAGATVVLQRRFDLNHALESIARDGVTMFFGVPTIYSLFLDNVDPRQLSNVRYYFCAAAPLSVEIEKRWAEKFSLPIYQGYGLTETSPFASYNHLEEHRPGSIGTPIDGVEMKVVNPKTGLAVGPGEKGEIVVRGHNVMLGYWNRPAETANVVRDGWFHTGDIGRVDGDGYFFIDDRLSDMIISGGVNVYPAEIENVLYAHPSVAEAAVYGVPEPFLGEQVCADIVVRSGCRVSSPDISTFCRLRLAEIKVPASIRFVAEIPRGPTGKILKRVLRERAVADVRTDARTERMVTRAEAETWIDQWLVTNLKLRSGLSERQNVAFADLGMDSIFAVKFAHELAVWLGREIEITLAWNFPTTDALASHLATSNAPQLEPGVPVAYLSNEAAEAMLFAELEGMNAEQ